MRFDPSEDEETGPCSFFCLWTHLHGWRHFALTKNKGFWIIWILIFILCIILFFMNAAGQIGWYLAGLTSQYNRYHYIWEGENIMIDNLKEDGVTALEYPSITICPETAKIPTSDFKMCEEIGLGGYGKGFEDKKITMEEVTTDHGMCCTMNVDQPQIRQGMVNGLNVQVYPGASASGVYVALHEKGDFPLMKTIGKFVAKGQDVPVDIKPEKWDSLGIWCYRRDNESRNKRTYKVGVDLTMSTCLYNNMMHNITNDCKCEELSKCNDETKWKCANGIMEDSFAFFKEPIYCKEACNLTSYTPMMDAKPMTKDPKICDTNWLKKIKEICGSNSASIENGYSGLCSQANAVTCPSDDPYSGRANLQKFAKENLISLKFYFKDYWMKTSYTYFIKSTNDLFNGILLALVAIFGFSMMSIPELLYYLFCGRGGGCVCGPIMKNCA